MGQSIDLTPLDILNDLYFTATALLRQRPFDDYDSTTEPLMVPLLLPKFSVLLACGS